MGIVPSIGNLGVLVASMYPIFIVTFLVIASLFNLRLNGLIYLLGIIITFGICWITAILPIGDERIRVSPITCDFFSTFGYPYKNPSFQAAVTSFTFIYLLLPMLQNVVLLNPVVISFTAIFAIINMVYLVKTTCASIGGILLGSGIGLLLGSIWFAIFWSSNKSLLFYNELVSNNVICNKPSSQRFKCSIYRGGELISSSVV
jgi:hypothetical protein